MNKSKKFLIKISSRNKKWSMLREKEKIYSKLLQFPECLEECNTLKGDINFIRKELNLEKI